MRHARRYGSLFLILLCSAIGAVVGIANAGEAGVIPRIGILVPSRNNVSEESFRDGLRALGYREGQNIVVNSRIASDRYDELNCRRTISCAARWTSSCR